MRTQIKDFRPDVADEARALDYWRTRGRYDLVINDQIDAFIDHHKAHGNTMADWSRAWGTWFRNALRFTQRPREAYKPMVKQFTPDASTKPEEWRRILGRPGRLARDQVNNWHPEWIKHMSDVIRKEYGFTK